MLNSHEGQGALWCNGQAPELDRIQNKDQCLGAMKGRMSGSRIIGERETIIFLFHLTAFGDGWRRGAYGTFCCDISWDVRGEGADCGKKCCHGLVEEGRVRTPPPGSGETALRGRGIMKASE